MMFVSQSRRVRPTVRYFWREFISVSNLERDCSPILDEFEENVGGCFGKSRVRVRRKDVDVVLERIRAKG
jgi:hypothetical protein